MRTFLAFLSATAATDFLAGEADLGVVAVGHSLVSMSLSASNFFFPDFCHIVKDSMVCVYHECSIMKFGNLVTGVLQFRI